MATRNRKKTKKERKPRRLHVSEHFMERMEERGVHCNEVYATLKKGKYVMIEKFIFSIEYNGLVIILRTRDVIDTLWGPKEVRSAKLLTVFQNRSLTKIIENIAADEGISYREAAIEYSKNLAIVKLKTKKFLTYQEATEIIESYHTPEGTAINFETFTVDLIPSGL